MVRCAPSSQIGRRDGDPAGFTPETNPGDGPPERTKGHPRPVADDARKAESTTNGTAGGTLLLIGQHELTIDEKNRLLLPAEHRRALKTGPAPVQHARDELIVTIGMNRKLWIYPAVHYEAKAAEMEDSLTPLTDEHRVRLALFARANRVKMDKQGRLLLPDRMLRRCGTEREVALVGVKDHLEVWNHEDWEREQDVLFDVMEDLSRREDERRRTTAR